MTESSILSDSEVNMEFMNTLYSGIMFGNGVHFARDLLSLSKDILQIEDEISQWKIFLQFKRQYLWYNRRMIAAHFGVMPRSLDSCYALMNKVEEFHQKGLDLSTLLMNLIASIYLKNCVQGCYWFNWNLYKTFPVDGQTHRVLAAFRGNTDFMKLLVKFGYFTGLQAGSPLLRKQTEIYMLNFM